MSEMKCSYSNLPLSGCCGYVKKVTFRGNDEQHLCEWHLNRVQSELILDRCLSLKSGCSDESNVLEVFVQEIDV